MQMKPFHLVSALAAMAASATMGLSTQLPTMPEPVSNVPRLRAKRRKPNSYSVKSWARYLARNGRDAVPIRNPEKFMNAAARRRFMFAATGRAA